MAVDQAHTPASASARIRPSLAMCSRQASDELAASRVVLPKALPVPGMFVLRESVIETLGRDFEPFKLRGCCALGRPPAGAHSVRRSS